MKELFIYRGLPGSGKTTRAKELQKVTGARIVGRDHLRELLYGLANYKPSNAKEQEVTRLQEKMIRDGLRADQMVIVDDMNLKAKYMRRLMEIAIQEGAEYSIIDLTDVPVETCVERDLARDRQVRPEQIRDLHKRFIQGQPYPLPLPNVAEKPSEGLVYEPPADAPPALIVDIDGTVAKMNGRSPYDYTKVSEDLPNDPVIGIVKIYYELGYEILFTSGRPDSCREDTVKWIKENVNLGWDYQLFMRNAGDHRKDSVVKRELFDRHIRENFRVEFVLDDRDQVVEMWRSLDLTCLQVAEGNF